MKRFLVFLAALCSCLVGCCAPVPRPPKVDTQETRVWREYELTLHADTAFTGLGRANLREAATRWRVLSKGRIRLNVVFDLDFDSEIGMKEHFAAKHAMVIPVLSTFSIVEDLDARLRGPNFLPLAATIAAPELPRTVFVILDRIPEGHFLAIITHEFGHVAGMPDLPTLGSIMSGAEVPGEAAPSGFTAADIALCEAYRYCD